MNSIHVVFAIEGGLSKEAFLLTLNPPSCKCTEDALRPDGHSRHSWIDRRMLHHQSLSMISLDINKVIINEICRVTQN